MAFLTLGSREDLSARSYMEGYLEDTFLFAILGGVLKEDKAGSEMGYAGALPLPTIGV